MSVINKEKDRKGKEVVYATGIVEFVKLNKYDKPKTFDYQGKTITSTHNASLLLKEKGAGKDDPGVWISLGDIELKEGYENLQVKYEDKWTTIEKGVEVSIDIQKVNQVGDKTYYQTKKSQISILSLEGVQAKSQTGGKAPQQTQGKSSFKKRDMVGVEVGHALNGALELERAGVKGDTFDLAGIVQSATVTLKAQVASERGVSADDYDVGASVGHAVLNACRDYCREYKSEIATIENLIQSAKKVLAIAVRIEAAIRGNAPAQEEKKNTPKQEVKPQNTPAPSQEPPMDFDDDIPF